MIDETQPQSRPEDEGSTPARFMQLFDGHTGFYGRYNSIASKPDIHGKKIGSDRKTLRGNVTVELWAKHLAGESGLGICPIREDSTVRFGAIDIDVYAELNHAALAKTLENSNLPLVVCRSKSGGAHIYCFTSEPVPASLMVAKLKEIAAFLAHGNAEIFPKQEELGHGENDFGSWLNMPFFQGMLAGRHAVRGDGSALDTGEFLDYAKSLQQSIEWFEERIFTPAGDVLPDGPPCLQRLIQIRGFEPGTRNGGLFNLAVYHRKVNPDGNWRGDAEESNRRYMAPPLDSSEVKTILNSAGKRDYFYTCSLSPISAYCDKRLCHTRKFGVGTGPGGVEIGSIRQLGEDLDVFFVTVNGKSVRVDSASLQDQRKFQRECIRQIKCMPYLPKNDKWTTLINDLLQNHLEIMESPSNATDASLVWDLVEKFCTRPGAGGSRSEILLGKAWTEEGRTYFRVGDVEQFLKRNGSPMKRMDIWLVLREHGGLNHEDFYLKDTVKKNVWSVPAFARQVTGHDLPDLWNAEKQF